MDRIYAVPTAEITEIEKQHMDFARKLAGECVVLMENDGVLPLKKVGAVALYGNGARQTVKGGTGSGDVYSRNVTTIEQGLTNAGFSVLTGDWLSRYDKKRSDALAQYDRWLQKKSIELQMPSVAVGLYHQPKETAPLPILSEDIQDTDTAIYVIARKSGEGADRFAEKGDYYLFDEEVENLRALAKAYPKLIVLLNVGGVIDMKQMKEIEGINAIVLMGQLGNIGGDAIVDVLLGKVTPSGKLTDSWAGDYADYPSAATFSHNNGNVLDEYYTEGIYVGYRYFDTMKKSPLYCFGYGKSYTEFAFVTECVAVNGNQIHVAVTVTNVGKEYAGKEVIQLYYSAPAGKLVKPQQELIAFGKTNCLSPGESEKIELTVNIVDMASYSEADAAWILEQGNYILRLGNSSRNTQPIALIKLEETVRTLQLKNVLGKSDFPQISVETVKTTRVEEENLQCRFTVHSAEIPRQKAVYQGKRMPFTTEQTRKLTADDVRNGRCTVEELVSQLTVKELAAVCVGTFSSGEVDANVIGGASDSVPGAAGDTTSILKESRGIEGVIFADGPAGLRLTPHFKVSPNGKILSAEENAEGAKDYYQYCTAIPIGWSLAQSWDTKILESAGKMIGREMEQFHIDLWLAPSMNIHRNPLCGRNFEYYSEDPLISGKMAAAITRGVQSNAGKGTSLKHFAANNAEDNRYFQNAHACERALREIYLKGFEITVRESQPFAIMTSYNLINGTHAANSYDLLQSVLRDEWGYEGLVMTDWFASQNMPVITGKNPSDYPISASTGCCYAGNDLQMPGCKQNANDLIKAVETREIIDGYQVTLADLQQCAANIIRVVLKATEK